MKRTRKLPLLEPRNTIYADIAAAIEKRRNASRGNLKAREKRLQSLRTASLKLEVGRAG